MIRRTVIFVFTIVQRGLKRSPMKSTNTNLKCSRIIILICRQFKIVHPRDGTTQKERPQECNCVTPLGSAKTGSYCGILPWNLIFWFFFFVEEIKRSFLKINLMFFSIGRIIGYYEKNGFMEPRCFTFSGGRNRVYIDSSVSVQIKPLRPFGRFKMVIFAFQNITNCNVEIILSLTSASFGSESLG